MTVATLLNSLSKKMKSRNDKDLSIKLGVYPSTVSRIRREQKEVGPAFILACHERSGIRKQLAQEAN